VKLAIRWAMGAFHVVGKAILSLLVILIVVRVYQEQRLVLSV